MAAEVLLIEEIITNILVRSPVKSLVRFKCVCKSWRSLINDPYFIRYHANHVNRMNTYTENVYEHQIFITDRARHYSSFHCMDIYKRDEDECDHQDNTNGGTPIEILVKDLDFPREFIPEDYYDGLEITGCCDGMLCLVDSEGILIWNPSIKECRRLPFPHPPFNWSGDAYGFGYDPSTDDYKVLKAPSRSTKSNDYPTVDIFALKSNSWKKIQDNFPYYIMYPSFDAIFTNGSIHWLASLERYKSPSSIVNCDIVGERLGEVSIIVYCDIVGERLGEVSLPHCRDGDEGWFSSLKLLREKLSLLWVHRGGDKLDLWVMKEYKVRESWTKLLTVPLSGGPYNLPNSFCFVRDGIVLYNKRSGEFLKYNSHDKSSRTFRIGSLNTYSIKIAYTESLVSPVSGYGILKT